MTLDFTLTKPQQSSTKCPQCGAKMTKTPTPNGFMLVCPACQPKLFDVPVKQTWRDQ